MKIDKSKLKHGIWYEDKDGNYIPSTESVDAPEEAVTCHVCFPLQIRTEHYRIKPHIDPDGNIRRTYYGSDRLLTTSCHIGGGNEPVILAMVHSGDFTLSEALAVYANACERCANVLAYKYLNGGDGYPEYSREWIKCGTVCDYCKDEKAEDIIRGPRIDPIKEERYFMEEKYCRNCLHARTPGSLRFLGKNEIQCKFDGYRYLKSMPACDNWASRYIDEAHEEKVFDVTQLKPSSKRYIFCNIDSKTGEGHLVVKLDLKFRTRTMLPDAIYSMTLREILDMEDIE